MAARPEWFGEEWHYTDFAFNEKFRYGSAHWADAETARPLLKSNGIYLGVDARGRILRHPGDGPVLMVAGSGAGKGVSGGLMFNACTHPGSMLIPCFKGEITKVSLLAQAIMGKHAYCVNPTGMHDLPNHTVDPLDILKRGSPTLVSDAKMLAEMLKTLSGSKEGAYFELQVRRMFECLMLTDVEYRGRTSLARLYKIITSIEGDPEFWIAFCDQMLKCKYEHVRSFAGEFMMKMRDAPKEASGILGEAALTLSFLDEPSFREGLEKPDFSLEVLCERRCNVYINIPAEYISIWGPYLRLLIGVAMLYKQRHPEAPRTVFMLDECGQLGRADFLLRAMTFGRGAGILTQAVFQDLGQVATNFGLQGIRTFMASSQVRQFFGVGDQETAEMVSRMLGEETLEFNDELQRLAAQREMANITQQVMQGANPFDAGPSYAHQARIACDRKKMSRRLMTSDEILSMPRDRQILYVRDFNCPPVYAWRKPYYAFPALAGWFLPNPFHPPADRVLIATRGGMRWARVVTERVPKRFADYPQYQQSGMWSYVDGFHPLSLNLGGLL